jgi:hypothetical protein
VSMEPQPESKAVHRRVRRSWISSLPLLIIPLLAYVGFAAAGADFATPRFDVTLPSAGVWHIALGDILLVIALGLLFFEILKATRTGGATVVDHAFSMIVFVVCLILFLVWDRAASSTFFLLMLMAMIDVIAGFSVTINAARRERGSQGFINQS